MREDSNINSLRNIYNSPLHNPFMTKTALLLVDLENEWTNQSSQYYLGDLTSLIKRTNALIKSARKKQYKIMFIRHVEKGSKTEFAANSPRTQLIPTINREPHDRVITKYKIGSFYQTELEKELSGIKHLIVTGVLTNLCVRSLIQDAYDREFQITVVKDCCQTFTRKLHNVTLQDLKETRPEINLTSLRELLATLE